MLSAFEIQRSPSIDAAAIDFVQPHAHLLFRTAVVQTRGPGRDDRCRARDERGDQERRPGTGPDAIDCPGDRATRGDHERHLKRDAIAGGHKEERHGEHGGDGEHGEEPRAVSAGPRNRQPHYTEGQQERGTDDEKAER